ncbi:MAG: hypothetical protein A3A43_00700 [Candidatus Liptonbacteria bacterium RIFCSPLOWO2_01_FULL_56_20]|uniref:Uncharacterized protein n=1 Tax=Candidatus Liptonbacteria bacterium RIFCSPLOWO2_01_FULL_56_20 TaxID=1798652 RepID=A0A1G2CIX6_9BACT|nr:MAG: hypothetical protein A3A43_00700 [Candidatus Liptonbacteria bacterium RIFCSPLOWO2_01_FULL_56_20]
MEKQGSKPPSLPPLSPPLSPHAIAVQTADDRMRATMRAIQTLRPHLVFHKKTSARTETVVTQK